MFAGHGKNDNFVGNGRRIMTVCGFECGLQENQSSACRKGMVLNVICVRYAAVHGPRSRLYIVVVGDEDHAQA